MAIKGDILERILVAIVLNNIPMEISWFFYVYLINVGHIWNCEIFESDISPPQMTENKTKKN